jgi:hypothetical protein
MTADEAAASLKGVIAAPDVNNWIEVLGTARGIYEQARTLNLRALKRVLQAEE